MASLKFILLTLLTITLVLSVCSDESQSDSCENNDCNQEGSSEKSPVVIIILPQPEQTLPEEAAEPPTQVETAQTVAPSPEPVLPSPTMETAVPSQPTEAVEPQLPVYERGCRGGKRCCKDREICKGINCTEGCSCTYKCGRRETVSAVICEGKSEVLKCPKGKVIQVISAIYGRQSGDLCWNDNMQSKISSVTCIRDVTLLLAKECNNKAVCHVESCNALAGDPCPGTFKYLSIQYRCYITISRV